MTDTKGLRASADRTVRRAGKSDGWNDYGRGWPNGAPLAKPPAPSPTELGRHRHAAITRTLFSYANYKSWADKVRTTWDPDQDKKG